MVELQRPTRIPSLGSLGTILPPPLPTSAGCRGGAFGAAAAASMLLVLVIAIVWSVGASAVIMTCRCGTTTTTTSTTLRQRPRWAHYFGMNIGRRDAFTGNSRFVLLVVASVSGTGRRQGWRRGGRGVDGGRDRFFRLLVLLLLLLLLPPMAKMKSNGLLFLLPSRSNTRTILPGFARRVHSTTVRTCNLNVTSKAECLFACRPIMPQAQKRCAIVKAYSG